MAIALDATASGNVGTQASPGTVTVSHVLGGGANRAVVVCFCATYTTDSTVTYGVKYNGVAMTQAVLVETTTTHRIASGIFYILDASLPATGTYNAVVTATTTGNNVIGLFAEVYSFTGFAQSAQPDATNSYQDATGGSSISKSVTTVADNSWIVDSLALAPSTITGATAAGSQANAIFQRIAAVRSTCSSTLGPVTPAGATSTGWGTFVGATPTSFTYAQASFSPAAGSTAKSDTETGTGADAGESIAAALADAETGSGTDAGESVAAALTAAETGTGTDAGEAIAVAITDSDTGSGIDAGTLAVGLTDADLASFLESEAIAAALADADTGTGVEDGSVTISGLPDPNPITATLRDRGHTATVEDSGHTVTAREV